MEHDKLQALMTQAYDRWQADRSMSKQAFWDQLDADERLAVFCGNFNYQVCNGGFIQWYDNGYATPEVIGFIKRVNERLGTDLAKQVNGLLSAFEEALENYDEDATDGDADDEWRTFYEATDDLCSAFYKINDAWLVEVATLLK